MAVGDAFSVLLGTGTVNRQPSAGVEEQVTSALKGGGTDALVMYNGSATVPFLTPEVRTYSPNPQSNADSPHMDFYNTSMHINNTVYIRKEGTSERVFACGIQVG
jgi:hypothetical protein